MTTLSCPHCERTIRAVRAFPTDPDAGDVLKNVGNAWLVRRELQCNWCYERFDHWVEVSTPLPTAAVVNAPTVATEVPERYTQYLSGLVTYRSSPHVIKHLPIPRTPFWKRLVRFRTVRRMLKRRAKRREILRTEELVRKMVQDRHFARPEVLFWWVHDPKEYRVSITFGETWWGGQLKHVFVEGKTPELLLTALHQALAKEGERIFREFKRYVEDIPESSPVWRDEEFRRMATAEVDAFAIDKKQGEQPNAYLRRLAQTPSLLIFE